MIAIGSDHGGFILKEQIKKILQQNNIEFKDYGCFDEKSCDYPDIAKEVCQKINEHICDKGILICGTGIGISIAANKIKNIRAALCSDIFSAKYTRLHNNSNVLCLGARVIGVGLACEIVDTFLNTDYEGGRHDLRLEKITKLENL